MRVKRAPRQSDRPPTEATERAPAHWSAHPELDPWAPPGSLARDYFIVAFGSVLVCYLATGPLHAVATFAAATAAGIAGPRLVVGLARRLVEWDRGA